MNVKTTGLMVKAIIKLLLRVGPENGVGRYWSLLWCFNIKDKEVVSIKSRAAVMLLDKFLESSQNSFYIYLYVEH